MTQFTFLGKTGSGETVDQTRLSAPRLPRKQSSNFTCEDIVESRQIGRTKPAGIIPA